MEEGGEEEVEEARMDDGDARRLLFCTGGDNSKILADRTLHEATLLVTSVDNGDDDDTVEFGKKTKAKEDRSERVAKRGLLGDSIVAGYSKVLQRKDCFNRSSNLLKFAIPGLSVCVEHGELCPLSTAQLRWEMSQLKTRIRQNRNH